MGYTPLETFRSREPAQNDWIRLRVKNLGELMKLILDRILDTESVILEEAIENVRDHLKEAQNALLQATHAIRIVSELVERQQHGA